MAQATLPLFLAPKRWVHRRVERIEFLDRQTVKRHVSVDFTLPTELQPVGTFDGKDVYSAPLFLLGKDHTDPCVDADDQPLPTGLYSDVTLTDGTGKRLPLITRLQSSKLAAAMLGEAARQIINDPIPDKLRDSILTIPTLDSEGRVKALREVLDDPLDHAEDVRHALRESDFPELAYALAAFSPIVCLLVGPPGRCVAKMSYVEPIGQPRSDGWFNSVRRGIGWKSEYLSVRVNEIGAAASHHIEVDVPSELQVNAVSLTGQDYELIDKPSHALTRDEKRYLILQARAATKGNIYISDPPHPRKVGEVSVKMRVRRTGFLLGAFTASLIMTLVLGALAYATPAIQAAKGSNGAVAVLLLLPSVVAAYIARPGEHVITSRMLRWARFALVGNATLPFIAVLFLLTASRPEGISELDLWYADRVFEWLQAEMESDSELQARWAFLAIASGLFTILFAISCIFPYPHEQSRYFPRPAKPSDEDVSSTDAPNDAQAPSAPAP